MRQIKKLIRTMIPKQKEMSSWLGGLDYLLRRTAFWFSILNLILISHVFFVTSPAIQDFFGSYWLFLVILGFGLLALMAFEYMIMVPSAMRFQQEQTYKSYRSPLWPRLDRIERELREIKKMLEKKR